LVYKSLTVTIVYLVNIAFFAVVMRVLVYNLKFVKKDSTEGANFVSTRFDNLYFAYYSLFIASTGDNFPGVLNPFVAESVISFIIIALFCVFTPIVMMSVLTGVFATEFGNFYAQNLEAVLEKDPGYKNLILKCLECEVLHPKTIESNFGVYEMGGIEALDNIIDSESADDLDEISVNSEDCVDDAEIEDSTYSFVKIYENPVYDAITGIIDFMICFVPIIMLDNYKVYGMNSNYYLLSELLCIYSFAQAGLVFSQCKDKHKKSRLFLLD